MHWCKMRLCAQILQLLTEHNLDRQLYGSFSELTDESICLFWFVGSELEFQQRKKTFWNVTPQRKGTLQIQHLILPQVLVIDVSVLLPSKWQLYFWQLFIFIYLFTLSFQLYSSIGIIQKKSWCLSRELGAPIPFWSSKI